jgi:hypothetical protein
MRKERNKAGADAAALECNRIYELKKLDFDDLSLVSS